VCFLILLLIQNPLAASVFLRIKILVSLPLHVFMARLFGSVVDVLIMNNSEVLLKISSVSF